MITWDNISKGSPRRRSTCVPRCTFIPLRGPLLLIPPGLSTRRDCRSPLFSPQEDVINTQCGYDARQKPVSGTSSCRLAPRVLEELMNLRGDAVFSSSLVKEVDQQIVIYTKGCVPQFEKWLQDNLTIVAGVFIGIALLQVRPGSFLDGTGKRCPGESSPGRALCPIT